MEATQYISVELLQTLMNTVKKNGVQETIKLLRSKIQPSEIDDKNITKVINAVCDEFSIDIDDLRFERYQRGDFKYAVGFCIYYLYGDYTMAKIINSGVFQYKHRSVLTKYRLLIEKLNSKYKNDIPYIKIKARLDKILKK